MRGSGPSSFPEKPIGGERPRGQRVGERPARRRHLGEVRGVLRRAGAPPLRARRREPRLHPEAEFGVQGKTGILAIAVVIAFVEWFVSRAFWFSDTGARPSDASCGRRSRRCPVAGRSVDRCQVPAPELLWNREDRDAEIPEPLLRGCLEHGALGERARGVGWIRPARLHPEEPGRPRRGHRR